MLGLAAFCAALVLAGEPWRASRRAALLPGLAVGGLDAALSLYVSWASGDRGTDTFSHLMIALLVAVVATAGFSLAADAGLAGARSRRNSRKGAARAGGLAFGIASGLLCGVLEWRLLLARVPGLEQVMAARPGGWLAGCLGVFEGLLVADVIYRLFVLAGIAVALRELLPEPAWAARAAAVAGSVLVMRWDEAFRSRLQAAAGCAGGLVLIASGFLPLVAGRLAAAFLAWPIARWSAGLGLP